MEERSECAFVAMESFLNTALLCKFLLGKKSRIEVGGEHTLYSSFQKLLADVAVGPETVKVHVWYRDLPICSTWWRDGRLRLQFSF